MSDGFIQLGNLAIPCYVAAIATVLIELFLALGFWFRKTRWISAVIGVSFHLALKLVLTIFMLDYVSMFLYLSFLIPFGVKETADANEQIENKVLAQPSNI